MCCCLVALRASVGFLGLCGLVCLIYDTAVNCGVFAPGVNIFGRFAIACVAVITVRCCLKCSSGVFLRVCAVFLGIGALPYLFHRTHDNWGDCTLGVDIFARLVITCIVLFIIRCCVLLSQPVYEPGNAEAQQIINRHRTPPLQRLNVRRRQDLLYKCTPLPPNINEPGPRYMSHPVED